MIRSSLTAALALLASQATALSCIPADPVRTYLYADESEDGYMVLWGRFDFVPSEPPENTSGDPNLVQPAPPVVATFSGYGLGSERFSRRFSGEVVMEPTCFGPWCSWFPKPGDGLAFVLTDGSTHRLVLDPCGGQFFGAPSRQMIRAVEACHAGEACDPLIDW